MYKKIILTITFFCVPLQIFGMEEFFEDEDDSIQQGWYDVQAQEIKEAMLQSLSEEINQHVADEYFLSATPIDPLTIRDAYLFSQNDLQNITEMYASSDLTEPFHKHSHETLHRFVDIPTKTITYYTTIGDDKVVQEIDQSVTKNLHNFEWIVTDIRSDDAA